MSFSVIYHPDAQDDLDRIEQYLALRFYPGNAAKYVARIMAACDNLGLAPWRGATRDNLGSRIRTIGFERRVTISFVVEEQAVVILGIFYAGRLPR